MMKVSVHQEDKTVTWKYAYNKTDTKYQKQKCIEIKDDIDNSKIIAKDFNTLLSEIDKPINKKSANYR